MSTEVSLACAGRGASAAKPLRHRVRRRRATWDQAPSCRATRLDRAERTSVAHQGVWHARGNRAIANDVTLAVVRCHRLGDSVAPRVGEGRNNVLERGRYASPVSESVHGRDGSSGRTRSRTELIGSRDAFHRAISYSLAAVRTVHSTWPAFFTRAMISLIIFPWTPALECLTHRCAISDLYEEPMVGGNQSRYSSAAQWVWCARTGAPPGAHAREPRVLRLVP